MTESGLILFKVIHARFIPKKYKFTHNFFWFKINLNDLNKSLPSYLMAYNKWGLYSFYDSDHIKLGALTARDNYIKFAHESGLETKIQDVVIYTQLRFLGYVFNPVSFILLKDVEGKEHAIIEIGNTFNELKPFFVSNEHFNENGFVFKTKKYFYISPFIDHDNDIEFRLIKKEGNISISIDDTKDNKKVLQVNLVGTERKITKKELFWQTLKNPFVTFQFIFFIHLHAMVLVMKGIKYFKKSEHTDLQKGVHVWKV